MNELQKCKNLANQTRLSMRALTFNFLPLSLD